jgi:hypothetical protein
LKPEFWEGFQDVPASGIVDFLKRIKEGSPVEVPTPPARVDKKQFEIDQQVAMLHESIEDLRKECNVGFKSYHKKQLDMGTHKYQFIISIVILAKLCWIVMLKKSLWLRYAKSIMWIR